MATWRERIRPATFRNVPFHVDAAELAGGRKTVTHEYPQRDVAYVEDLGRKGRGFQIDGYVLGADYFAQRDRLLDALEQPGPGTLVHPYYGTRLVAVTAFTLRETRDEGGYALFSIDLAETAADPVSPSIAQAPGAQVAAAADAATAASHSRLLASYRIAKPLFGAPGLPGVGAGVALPSFTFSSVTGLITSFSTTLERAMAPVMRGVQEASSLRRQVASLALAATDLVRTPLSLATRIGDMFTSLVTWPATPRLGIAGLVEAYRFTPSTPRPSGTTLARQYEQVNFDAVDRFIRRQIAVEAARLLGEAADRPQAFDSYEDAIAARDEVIALLDTEAERAGDDPAVFSTLTQLRAVVAAVVPPESVSLPRLVPYTPPVSVPVLTLAYRLYGDLALADDLLVRNRVRHPGFVLGGRALQVLADA